MSLVCGICSLWASLLATIAALLWSWGKKQRPVSYPGDARPVKEARRARWTPRRTSIPQGWLFAEDHASQDVSRKVAPELEMTGDPCGRQIWYMPEDLAASCEAEPRGTAASLLTSHPGALPAELSSIDNPPSFSAAVNPNSADKLLRASRLAAWKGPRTDTSTRPATAMDAARKGVAFYQMLQCDDGHWAGDYGGPMFLMPGLIAVLYLTGSMPPRYKQNAMALYLLNHQQSDGGWGTHIEGASTMFGTVLSYVALRLLGEGPDAPHMAAARAFIHENGGALYTASWAKFWLAVLGLYEWEGINSIPAEMWMLPRAFPFQPGRLWCHCRMVYLPMCYAYSSRFSARAEDDELLSALRRELYLQPYETIDWDAHRFSICPFDNYSPVEPVMRLACNALALYERYLVGLAPFRWLRSAGLRFVMDYIHAEDAQTNYVCIGPVNKALNMLAVWVDAGRDPTCEAFRRHLQRVDDFLWVAEDGMKMQGYNGSQCWDTSFAIQGIVEAGLDAEFPDMVRRVYSYLDRTQIATDEDRAEFWFRHVSKGGWPFSTSQHGWPISDCTAEGLKAVLALADSPCVRDHVPLLSEERICDAVNVILTLHNADGGWATYENNRGFGWYELLNPSETFGDIMIDYSYVECTAACMQALAAFRARYPAHRAAEVGSAIAAGARFIKSIQREDGSWYGSWGVCFTYGTWFGIEGLAAVGEADGPEVARAVRFLLAHQNDDGGWGESYLSCMDKAYAEEGTGGGALGQDGSGVVQTSWALLGLLAAGCEDRDAMRRAAELLMRRQRDDGDWDQEAMTGVFNRSCGITYTAYRNVFTTWALGRYGRLMEATK